MTKRELIDRKQAIKVVSNGFDRWHMINLLASQGSVPTITEQEIVKPYLDKIRVEIKAMSGDIETIADALQIIDKYKSESEDVEK